ncbi:MAG TPA: thioredoxin domain-containing protein [Candidatus Sulfotelmatobacter sp.]|nr:thioredoxin domain-containing protein [Candidatus Sulfotelmatobacter sp.]
MTSTPLNSLSHASSAYLRSAMHQPIQWHEWGPEAFAAAQRANKPMLLDIGAVWCHWCHVMDRESYDDPEIAAIVNQHFIAVKVDRDERPDIDSRYQVAVQAVSGQGGWPLTAFLTPDGKPFYGGTYFPPNDGYGRPSFRRVLLSIANAYVEKHGDVVEQAKMVEGAIAQSESFAGRGGKVSPGVITAIQTAAFRMFDPQHGGFGQAPKFPHPSALDLLIERYAKSRGNDESKSPPYREERDRMGHPERVSDQSPRTSDEELLNLLTSTLEHMARGGVYDQLAGGFHRYSVDERWVVPHFEKMCYDNSELLKNYVHGYQATGEEFFADVARDIIRWMDDWLSDRQKGGFYASQDADISMDDDGDYFTWTLEEARAVLTKEEAEVAALHYDINEVGEMHHNPAKNVLYVQASMEEIGRRMNLPSERVRELLATGKEKMYAARLQRPTPYIDKTVYVGWNSLCVSAYLEAAKVLNLAQARRFALKSLDRVLAEAWRQPPQKTDAGEGARATRLLLHVVAYSDPKATHREVPGLLDDYAFTTLACLDAYEANADLSYFKFAHAIADAMIARFYDATSGGFFDSEPVTGNTSLGVLATTRKPIQDSPTPAGNPMAAIALTRLHHYTDDDSYREKAELTLEAFAGVAEQFGVFAATYGVAVVHFLESPAQVVVIAEEGDEEGAEELYSAAIVPFAFNKSVLRLSASQAVAENLPPVLAVTIPQLPALRSHNPGSRKSFAVLCSGSSCHPPVFNATDLRSALELALGAKE